MAGPTRRKTWSDVANRRFLHSRLTPGSRAIEEYRRLDAVAKEFDTLPAEVRANVRAGLGRIQVRAHDVGCGFGDAVDELVHALDARAARVRPGKVDR